MKLNIHTIALYILAISSTAYAAAPAEPTSARPYITGAAIATGTAGIAYACKAFTWAKINKHYRNSEPVLIAGQVALCAAAYYGLYTIHSRALQLTDNLPAQDRQAAHSSNRWTWIGMCAANIAYYINYWGLFP